MIRGILVLDTPKGHLKGLARALSSAAGPEGDVKVVTTESDLLSRLRSGLAQELVVLDYFLGDGRKKGWTILKRVREEDSLIPIVAVGERGDVSLVAKAIRSGASDYLVRGESLTQRVSTLLGKVAHLLEVVRQNRILGERNMMLRLAERGRYSIIGESPQIREVVDRIERVAHIPRPVVIQGERGTGKELVARAIHDAGGSPDRPFVAVNCAASTEALLESELFGHEKGAFTGADHLSHGRFEQADGGTLFLDEIGHMSLAFQQKILRVVEYGVFTRVGGAAEIRTGVRIIAATNADLEAKMQEGEFLRDLHDRLAFEVIDVPPLRDREGDVDILARHFLGEFMREIPALGGKRLAASAVTALRRYPFPGNVRELKNIMERAAYRDCTNEITPEDLGLPSASAVSGEAVGRNFEEKVDNFRERLVRGALEEAGGNQAQAGRLLGLSYHQVRYYVRKYDLR